MAGVGITFLGNNPAAALEKAVRPFLDDPPKARQDRREPEQDTHPALITWGAKTNIEVTTVPALGFKATWPDRQDEISRTVSQKRVTNPNDSSQYIDLEVIDSVAFKSADGKRTRFNLDNGS